MPSTPCRNSSPFSGANIYPENITVGLEQTGIKEWVTGKFVLQVKEDADRNRFLFIAVELAPAAEASEERRQAVTASILHQLLRLNSEFANYVPAEYRTPKVELRPNGDPAYFPVVFSRKGQASLYSKVRSSVTCQKE